MRKIIKNKCENSIKGAGIREWFWRAYVRPNILIRDKFKCRSCGSKERLQIHSISKKHISVSDLLTLCKSCHDKEHIRINKISENTTNKK